MAELAILHVDSGREWRGGQDQARILMRGLRAVPGLLQALVTRRGSRLAQEAGAMGVPVYGAPFRFATDPRAVRTLARMLGEGWMVVHAHDSEGLQNAAAALALTGSAASLVATRNVLNPMRAPWLWQRARLVIAVSRAVREVLVRQGIDESRVRVVHGGVALSAGHAESRPGRLRAAAAVSDSRPLVGAVGALSPEKGYDVLARAAAEVARRVPRVQFAVYGEGPERGALERLIASLGLEGRFVLAGWLPDVASSLGDLDLFVMPSRREGFGAACLEAMAAGVPVILTSAGGLAELAEPDVPPVPPDDPEALAEAIVSLLTDGERSARRAESGRRRAARFGAERMVVRTLGCYREVVRP